MSCPVPTWGLTSRPGEALQHRALTALLGDSKKRTKMETEVHPGVHKPGQMVLLLLLLLLPKGWSAPLFKAEKEAWEAAACLRIEGAVLTPLLGHMKKHKALGEHYGPTTTPTFPLHFPPSASPISFPTAPSPASSSSSCPLGRAEGQSTITQVPGGIS